MSSAAPNTPPLSALSNGEIAALRNARPRSLPLPAELAAEIRRRNAAAQRPVRVAALRPSAFDVLFGRGIGGRR